MDYKSYRKQNFVDPPPEQRFAFSGLYGATLYYQDYQAALDFYSKVFGQPQYKEGENTHGWQIGETYLTLFPSKEGNPRNLEVGFYVQTREEVLRLYEAFLSAGAKAVQPPEDNLMYGPVNLAFLNDPFGVSIMLACWLPTE
jgi:uncharacterized glyoxalase superfamily protein PhnB